ncbi:MAG: pantoate--beta-alanine ligase [Candidatus Gastranaerophilales bacterium]
MLVVRSINKLKETINSFRKEGNIGFVPTMGALHEGHISLIEKSVEENKFTIASVFVNPTQFNDKNDLKNYPRTEEADFALLEKANCDVVFAPSVEEVYPEPDTREFNFGVLETVMEGATRPGHFNGVAQVVSKLFDFVEPDNAYFGEKDFQQVAIIKQMCKDFDLKVNIVACEIKRDVDGLALSSRNTLLSTEEREIAPVIYMTLKEALNRAKWDSVEGTKKWVIEQLDSNDMMKSIYFELVNSDTLQSVETWDDAENIQGCIAVQLGNIRLIDNINFKK